MRFKRQALTVGVVVALATLATLSPRDALGQTFTWANGTGNWDVPAQWVGGFGPLGATAFGADTLVFGDAGGAAYTATNNFTDGDTLSPAFFTVNKINLNSAVAGSRIIGSGASLPTIPLLFAGPSPSINQLGAGSFAIEHTIAVASTLAVNVAAGTGQLRLGIATDTATDGAKQPTLVGGGSVTITNDSTNPVLLGLSAGTIADGNNPAGRVGGFQGELNIAGTGTVRLTQSVTNDGGVPTAAPIVALTKLVHLNVAAGATFDFNGQDERIGSLSGGGTVILGGAYLVFDGRRDQDWSGSITGGTPPGAFNPTEPTILKPFTNARETNWIWRGDNDYAGDTDLRGGGLVQLVDGGRISGTTDGTDAGSEAIQIFRTELILDNNGAQNLGDRVRDEAGIQLAGDITLVGADAADSSETLGAINVSGPTVPPEENGVTHPTRAATLTVEKGSGHTATLTIASLTRATAAGASLDFEGDGDVLITAAPTPTNDIIGGWATKGAEWATMTGTTVTQLANYETSDVPADPLWAATKNVKIDGPLSGNVTASKTINTLNFASNQTLTIDPAQTLTIDSGGVLASTSGSIAGGSITAAGEGDTFARELRFHVVGAGNTLTVASAIANSGAGMVLTKTGDGVLKLTGTNTYGTAGAANQTNLFGGIVEIGSAANLGAGTAGLFFSGGTLRLAADVDLSATTRQIRTAGTMTVDTNGFSFSTNQNSISGYGSIVKKGLGTWIINGGNSFDGDIYIEQGTVQSSASNVGSLFDATSFAHISAGATLDLNNNNEDFGGPLGEGTVLTGNNPATGVAYTSANPPEDGQATFNGKVMGAGYLDSRSSHKVSLGGPSAFTGKSTIQTGGFIVTANVLAGSDGPLGNPAAGPDRTIVLGTNALNGLASSLEIGAAGVEIGRNIQINPGTVSSIGSTHTSGASTFSGAITLSKMLYVTAAGTSTVKFTGAIADAGASEVGGLTKIGPGTLVLSGTNTYTSGTYVADGTLLVNGANNGTGAVTVATAGTLGGTGTIAAPVTVFGTLAPGASVGTLSVANNVILNGTLSVEVSGATIDLLSITGGLTLGAESVLDIQGTLDGAATYVIATYNTGALMGTFADALDATTHGYNVVYDNTQIVLDELDGDANHDGVVNIFDMNLVSSNWNPTGPVGAFSPGNLNHDAVVNIFDVNLVSSNWNHMASNGGAAHIQPVPEPSTLVIALVGLLSLVGFRGRRRCVPLAPPVRIRR